MTTYERYTSPDDVRRLLRLKRAYSSTSNPNVDQVDSLIEQKMDVIDSEMRTSFRLSRTREKHSIRNGSMSAFSYDGSRVFLGNKNIVTPLSASAGDSLKVYNGSTDEEWVGVKSESRGTGNFWIDDTLGILFVKNIFSYNNYLSIDVTYRFNGGARSTLSGAVISGATGSVSLTDSSDFPVQGIATVSGEVIRFNNNVSNNLTVVERGAFNTQTEAQSSGAIIFTLPQDIRDACTKLVAIDLLNSEDWSSGGDNSGDIASGQQAISGKIERWRNDIDKTYDRYRPTITSIR